MIKIYPYLNFNGNAEEAFNFYKSIFGGEFAIFQRFGDMPQQEGCPELSEESKNKVLHVSYPINENYVLMASDCPDNYADKMIFGNNISLSIAFESKEEADRIFAGLSSGGEITMPIADTFWGAYFGMCKDKFGINWMINYDYPQGE